MATSAAGPFVSSRKSIVLGIAATVLAGFLAGLHQDAQAYANSPASLTGRTNKSGGVGCAGCHGAAADAGMTVTISGPAALNKSQAATYTVTATKTVANGTKMGLAVAASDAGTPLSVVTANTTVTSGEIIHASGGGALNTITSNTASYQVTYTMPAAALIGSDHTLYAVAVLGFAGGWKHAANFTVKTRPTAPTSVTASNITASSVNLAWSGGGPEYRVVYKTGAVAPTSETDGTTVDVGSATSTTISGLSPTTQYSFAVFSKLTGFSVFSTSAATTSATTIAAVVAQRYVNAATGSNTSICTSSGTPCKTITYAMSQATAGAPGDAINVAPGTYNVALGEVFPIAMKSGVQLQATGTAANTIVDATGANARVFIASGSDASTVIQGFTITGGFNQPLPSSNVGGGAILIDNLAAIKIRRNIFTGNEARGYSGVPTSTRGGEAYGGAINSSNSSPTIENNVFSANTARSGDGVNRLDGTAGGDAGNAHGGALFVGGGAAVIVNNTFHGNVARGGSGGSSNTGLGGDGGSAFNGAVESSGASVINNIFASNSAIAGTGGAGSPAGSPGAAFAGALTANSTPALTNNLFFGNTGPSNFNTLGINAVFQDPQFLSPPTNLRIGLTSPARAAGTATGAPAIDLDGTARPNPPSIGAFEASAALGLDVAVTDFNDDGKSDLLWRNFTTGQVYRMFMNGFAIGGQALVYTEPNTAWKIIADADFNADGVSDLLWRNDVTGQVFILLFNSSGFSFGGGLIYTQPNLAWKIVHTPDLDGDGKADLLWRNTSTGQVYAMLMNGLAIGIQGMVHVEPDQAWQIAGVGDFSDSGRQNQLVWRNGTTGQLYMMTVNVVGGGFTQSGVIFYSSQVAFKIVGIADFDGDQRDDILWRNDNTGQIYLMLMNGPAITFEGVIYTEPNVAWKIVAAGDYNGDGKADILWRNYTTGQVYMMLMNGAAISSQAMIYQEPNTAWRLLGPWEYWLP